MPKHLSCEALRFKLRQKLGAPCILLFSRMFEKYFQKLKKLLHGLAATLYLPHLKEKDRNFAEVQV